MKEDGEYAIGNSNCSQPIAVCSIDVTDYVLNNGFV